MSSPQSAPPPASASTPPSTSPSPPPNDVTPPSSEPPIAPPPSSASPSSEPLPKPMPSAAPPSSEPPVQPTPSTPPPQPSAAPPSSDPPVQPTPSTPPPKPSAAPPSSESPAMPPVLPPTSKSTPSPSSDPVPTPPPPVDPSLPPPPKSFPPPPIYPSPPPPAPTSVAPSSNAPPQLPPSPTPSPPPPVPPSAPNSSAIPSTPPLPSTAIPPPPRTPDLAPSGSLQPSNPPQITAPGSSPSSINEANIGTNNSPSSHTTISIIAGVVAGAILLLAICLPIFLYFRKKRKDNMKPKPSLGLSSSHLSKDIPKPSPSVIVNPPEDFETEFGISTTYFTYEELKAATNNFSQENLLGKGGFGNVYKGIIAGGQVVAIKQMNLGGGQGEREFRAEIEIISRVHHRHLVTLVGYCIMEDQRLLVYDYVPNRTLQYHLHGKGTPVMSWKIRQRIALGAAKGLAYLHEDCHPRIIHRDIKSSNILLDNNFEALVSDFGLAKLTPDANTHVTTRVMGTFGYLAPEYASSGKLTYKSDVFSFGVVLLELVTGRRPVNPSQYEDSLVEWARPLLTQVLEQRNFEIIVDPNLNNDYDEDEMMTVVEAAAACVRYSANKRPKMGLVVRALEEEHSVSELNEGVLPGHSNLYSMGGSIDYDSTQFRSDNKRFRKKTVGSQKSSMFSSDYGSSTEYSEGPESSEYGQKSSMLSSEFQSSQEVERNPLRS